MDKVYHAIVVGRPGTKKGCISQAIGRHRSNRKKMAVLQYGGREAVTCWSVQEEFADHLTYLEVRPETGRTHQIRVHMAHIGHPVAGDALYGNRQQKQTNEKYCSKLQLFAQLIGGLILIIINTLKDKYHLQYYLFKSNGKLF